MEYNRLPHTWKKKWNLCYCDGIECAICHDGLLFMFEVKDIQHLLDNYPKGNKVWYFNKSKDREIAEEDFGYVTVNPQFCYQNFKEILT